jgi:multidrug efflux pump subunit AcrB
MGAPSAGRAYLIVVFALAGAFAYQRLGQSEDPPFTFGPWS